MTGIDVMVSGDRQPRRSTALSSALDRSCSPHPGARVGVAGRTKRSARPPARRLPWHSVVLAAPRSRAAAHECLSTSAVVPGPVSTHCASVRAAERRFLLAWAGRVRGASHRRRGDVLAVALVDAGLSHSPSSLVTVTSLGEASTQPRLRLGRMSVVVRTTAAPITAVPA